MAYDRLLERLYLVDEGWIIKGATALLARDIGVRGTLDPLYTYIGDTAPGQANGNNLNLNGGLWHEVRVSR